MGLLAVGAVLVAVSESAAAAPRMVVQASAADSNDGGLLLTRCPHGICSLFSFAEGTFSRLPIGYFDLPDDARQADLGVGPGGHEVASYSRCRSVRDCDLYVYDFVTEKETRLPVSDAHVALTNPTVSGDRVAYSRDPLGRDVPSKRFGVYWSYLGSRRMHRVATMPLNVGAYLPRLDLAGTRLAYSGYSALTSCLDQSQVRVTRLGAKHGYGQLIAKGSKRTDVFSAHWSGGALYYGRDRFTKRSYRHDFTPGQITKSRIERHLPGAAMNQAMPWRRATMKQVLPESGALFYQAGSRHRRATGVYEARAPSFRNVAPRR